jgi:hypothetical protein
MTVQTRSEIHGIKEFDTLKSAFAHAKEDISVWKVSFMLVNREMVRLVRYGDYSKWFYEPIS